MRTTALAFLALLAIPGCLLVQPLDDAKPEDGNSAGSTGHTSGGNQNSGGAGNKAGSGPVGSSGAGNKAGSGPIGSAGGANGGAPSGVDFSLFTGSWTVTGGENTVTCSDGVPTTTSEAPGGVDTFGLGTVSDLILNPGATCELWADVDDHTASLNPSTPNCTTSDANYDYELYFESFDFVVSADGQTATATLTTSTLVSDSSGAVDICDSEHTWNYER